MSKLKELNEKCGKARRDLIVKMLLEEDVDIVLEREKRELQGYDLTEQFKYIINVLKDGKNGIKQRSNRTYYDKESREIRIPTSEIFPTCPTINGGDLHIKISLTTEDILNLVSKNPDKHQVLHCCEFQWLVSPF